MSGFNAFHTSNRLKKDVVFFLQDRILGAFPPENREKWWQGARNQLSDYSGPANEKGTIFTSDVYEPLFPFEKKYTLDDLEAKEIDGEVFPTEDRPLHPDLVKALKTSVVENYQFYEHQKNAFAQSVLPWEKGSTNIGKTLMISSGTGSGKTESFLISMLNRMYWIEDSNSLYKPGIRTLIIYPLNALINDQVKRIAALLNTPLFMHIRFGFYNSRTPESAKPAGSNEVPFLNQDNFVSTRKEIRSNPPHILITNYSMLEYTLIRPQDRTIFPGGAMEPRVTLQTVILDEAHTYSGSLGDDLSLLIRRCALRFGTNTKDIKGLATSATLSGADSAEKLKQIGAGLFSCESTDVGLIFGKRKLPPIECHEPWHFDASALTPDDIQNLFEINSPILSDAQKQILVKTGSNRNSDILFDHIAGCNEFHTFRTKVYEDGRCFPFTGDSVNEFFRTEGNAFPPALLNVFINAGRVNEKGQKIDSFMTIKIHVGISRSRKLFSDLIVTEETPLGNLHFAPDIYTDTGNFKSLFELLQQNRGNRREIYFKANFSIKVLRPGDEIFIVSPAGFNTENKSVNGFIRNSLSHDPDWMTFSLVSNNGILEADFDGSDFAFAIDPDSYPSNAVDYSPDTILDLIKKRTLVWKTVDGYTISTFGSDEGEEENIQEEGYSKVLSVPGEVSNDILSSVTIESILPNLPPKIDSDMHLIGSDNNKKVEGACAGRGLLMFNDTRRGAAWRAAQLQNSHNMTLIRSHIYRIILENDKPASIEDITEILSENNTFKREYALSDMLRSRIETITDHDERARIRYTIIKMAVCREVLMPVRRARTLEALGLIRAHYSKKQLPDLQFINDYFDSVSRNMRSNDSALISGIISAFNEQDYFFNWIAMVVDFMRMAQAIWISDILNKGNEPEVSEPLGYMKHNLNRRYMSKGEFTEELPADDRTVTQDFLSEKGNIFRYTAKLEFFSGFKDDDLKKSVRIFLEFIFDALYKYAESEHTRGRSVIKISQNYKLIAVNGDKLNFTAWDSVENKPQIQTGSKDNLLRLSRGHEPAYTPSRSRYSTFVPLCTEQLETMMRSWNLNQLGIGLDSEKAVKWGIRTGEHTAQLSSMDLYDLENRFRKGEVNILSCSTTMELGIDIGELSTVLMGNLPPESANYIQRAGRCGRRGESSSLVVTFLKNQPWDQTLFEQPLFMYNRPFSMAGVFHEERVVRRHLHAWLLSEFFKTIKMGEFKKTTGSCGVFFIGRTFEQLVEDVEGDDQVFDIKDDDDLFDLLCDPAEPICDKFELWLENHKGLILESVKIITGNQKETFATVVGRVAYFKTKLEDLKLKFKAEFRQTLSTMKNHEEEYVRKAVKKQLKQMLARPIIDFLGYHNLIPRYCFPTDVIPLYTENLDTFTSNKKGYGREDDGLSRKADLAIAEYAPGQQILVNKMVFTSAGIVFNKFGLKQGMFEHRYYIICKKCSTFHSQDTMFDKCPICEHPAAYPESMEQAEEQYDINKEMDGVDKAVATPIRRYILPSAFSVEKISRAKPSSYLRHQPPPIISSDVMVQTKGLPMDELGVEYLTRIEESKRITYTYKEEQRFLMMNMGNQFARNSGFGFEVCLTCGFTERQKEWRSGPISTEDSEENRKLYLRKHNVLYSFSHDVCKCTNSWRNMMLGCEGSTDVIIYRIPSSLIFEFPGDFDAFKAVNTLAVSMKIAVARFLGIDSRNIGFTTRQPTGDLNYFEIILFDSSMEETGYMTRLRHHEKEIFMLGLENLQCNYCLSGCTKCLVVYDTSRLVSTGIINRSIALEKWHSIIKVSNA